MNDLLQPFVGKKVEIRSQSGVHDYWDEGILIAYDERWVQICKGGAEMLFFPISNIRLLKPLN